MRKGGGTTGADAGPRHHRVASLLAMVLVLVPVAPVAAWRQPGATRRRPRWRERTHLQRRGHDRLRRRQPDDQPIDTPAPQLAGSSGAATADGDGYVWRARTGGLCLRRRQLRGLRRSFPCRDPSWPWPSHLTPRDTGWGRARWRCLHFGDAPFTAPWGAHPESADRRHGVDARRQGVLARGCRWGIFSYGDAGFYGSTGGIRLNEPIVGHGTRRTTARATGSSPPTAGIFTFGDASFYGSAGSLNLPDAAVGMVASPDGGGYLTATQNGVVLPSRRTRRRFGGLSLDPTATQISAIIGNNAGNRLLAARSAGLVVQLLDRHGRTDVPRLDDHRRCGGVPDLPDPDTQGLYCNPYGPCEQWCAFVRHLGLGAGGHPHSALRLHG